jgi:hypothetical protein
LLNQIRLQKEVKFAEDSAKEFIPSIYAETENYTFTSNLPVLCLDSIKACASGK